MPKSLAQPEQPQEPTILLVDSDVAGRVRAMTLLSDSGYQVFGVDHPEQALGVLSIQPCIAAMVVEATAPGPLSVRDLESRALTLHPDVELFIVDKPYCDDELINRVRHGFRNREQRLWLRSCTQASPSLSAEADLTKGANPISLRILLVEDSPETLLATADLLEVLGHRVTPVFSAEDALQALACDTFDVLCSDLNLPGMSGDTLARLTRRNYPGVGIVFASGYVDTIARPGGLDAVVLLKPYDVSALERALESAVLARSQA